MSALFYVLCFMFYVLKGYLGKVGLSRRWLGTGSLMMMQNFEFEFEFGFEFGSDDHAL